jgi:hypothetical protein
MPDFAWLTNTPAAVPNMNTLAAANRYFINDKAFSMISPTGQVSSASPIRTM